MSLSRILTQTRRSLLLFLCVIIAGCQSDVVSLDEAQTSMVETTISESNLETTQLNVGGKTYTVEIAKNNQERMTGLMNRRELAADAGMIFVFGWEDYYGFWMKNTLIPLDIIWINEEGIVVDFTTMQPCTTPVCEDYEPREPALYVLELNAGEFKGKIGDKIQLEGSLPEGE